MCIPCTSLKVVGYYDLSVLTMLVMGFKKKSLDGFVSAIQFIFGIFLTLQSPLIVADFLVSVLM